jgi:hypothetical protein
MYKDLILNGMSYLFIFFLCARMAGGADFLYLTAKPFNGTAPLCLGLAPNLSCEAIFMVFTAGQIWGYALIIPSS